VIGTQHKSATRLRTRKLELDDQAFTRIANIAYKEAGLAISPSKSAMVHTRVARRLRKLGIDNYDDYCALVESPEGLDERRELVAILTTNVSSFFREDHHFEKLRSEILPQLLGKLQNGGRVRIWSAGCSNGQEPYSIAMTILEELKLESSHDIKILATDINSTVVDFARSGIYDAAMLAGLPENRLATFLEKIDHVAEEAWRIKPEVKSLVSFRKLNLLEPWPMSGKFDVIFCRNVVIYFDLNTQKNLWKRFSNSLEHNGWLFLGHSERVSDEFLGTLIPAGMTTYRHALQPGLAEEM